MIKEIPIKQLIRCLLLLPILAFITPVNAAIVYYDIPDLRMDSSVNSSPTIYLDFEALTANAAYQYSGYPGYDLILGMVNGAKDPAQQTVGNWKSFLVTDSGNQIPKFSLNQELNGDIATSDFFHIDPSSNNDSPWDGETGAQKYYLGYINETDQKKAWIGVLYNDGGDTITITDFAVGDYSDNLKAGVVPEPAETALVMALVLSGALIWTRHKNSRTPTKNQGINPL